MATSRAASNARTTDTPKLNKPLINLAPASSLSSAGIETSNIGTNFQATIKTRNPMNPIAKAFVSGLVKKLMPSSRYLSTIFGPYYRIGRALPN